MVTKIGTHKHEYLYGTNDTGEVDKLFGMGGNDSLHGYAGENWLYGGSGDDRLNGNNDVDYLFGEDGNDTLFGGYGNDFLEGGAGDDKLYGGPGADSLSGGAGTDTFVWVRGHADANLLHLDPLADTITDFETGIDKIDISHFDADESTPFTRTRKGEPGNEAFSVVGESDTDGVTPGHLTLSYDPNSGYTTLRAYTNSEAGADFTLIVYGQVNPTDIIL